MAKHKEGCWYPSAVVEEKRYLVAWPNVCKRCDGWGGFPWYDDDCGYQGYDPCPECLERGKCPRCGGGVIAEEYWDTGYLANCDSCGFVESITPGRPLIEQPCSCILEVWPDFADVPY